MNVHKHLFEEEPVQTTTTTTTTSCVVVFYVRSPERQILDGAILRLCQQTNTNEFIYFCEKAQLYRLI